MLFIIVRLLGLGWSIYVWRSLSLFKGGSIYLGRVWPPVPEQLELMMTIRSVVINKVNRGLTVYVDSLYSTYLVNQFMMSYDDGTYLVSEIMSL